MQSLDVQCARLCGLASARVKGVNQRKRGKIESSLGPSSAKVSKARPIPQHHHHFFEKLFASSLSRSNNGSKLFRWKSDWTATL